MRTAWPKSGYMRCSFCDTGALYSSHVQRVGLFRTKRWSYVKDNEGDRILCPTCMGVFSFGFEKGYSACEELL